MSNGATYRRVHLVANDTPTLVFDLFLRDSGLPIDLSNALTSAKFKVRLATSSTMKAEVTCTKLVGRKLPTGEIDTEAPYNVAGAGGRCSAPCDATVFDAAGRYFAELEVTFGATSQVSTPYQMLDIMVRADI